MKKNYTKIISVIGPFIVSDTTFFTWETLGRLIAGTYYVLITLIILKSWGFFALLDKIWNFISKTALSPRFENRKVYGYLMLFYIYYSIWLFFLSQILDTFFVVIVSEKLEIIKSGIVLVDIRTNTSEFLPVEVPSHPQGSNFPYKKVLAAVARISVVLVAGYTFLPYFFYTNNVARAGSTVGTVVTSLDTLNTVASSLSAVSSVVASAQTISATGSAVSSVVASAQTMSATGGAVSSIVVDLLPGIVITPGRIIEGTCIANIFTYSFQHIYYTIPTYSLFATENSVSPTTVERPIIPVVNNIANDYIAQLLGTELTDFSDFGFSPLLVVEWLNIEPNLILHRQYNRVALVQGFALYLAFINSNNSFTSFTLFLEYRVKNRLFFLPSMGLHTSFAQRFLIKEVVQVLNRIIKSQFTQSSPLIGRHSAYYQFFTAVEETYRNSNISPTKEWALIKKRSGLLNQRYVFSRKDFQILNEALYNLWLKGVDRFYN